MTPDGAAAWVPEGTGRDREPSRVPATPLSERLCNGVCLVFAAWTICAHGVVAMGGSLRVLVGLFAIGLALYGVFARMRSPAVRADWSDLDGGGDPPRTSLVARWAGRSAAVLAVVAGVATVWISHPTLLWLAWVTTLGLAAVAYLWLDEPRFRAPLRSRGPEIALAALALLCAAYTLALHRPDADDSLYVNLAVGAVDLPQLPLLAHDTMHGLFELPIVLPSYKLHSWELWNGAIALLTGIPAIHVFHLISAALVAAWVPLAHATLFRRLTPAIWPVTTAVLVLVLAVAGDTHRWYGNFAFVRMWQGKGLLLFVFMPLIYAYGLRFARRGDTRSWILLAAAQIAALGCTANALWAAPAAALAALVCALPPNGSGLRRLAFGALASTYLIGAGLLLKVGTTAGVAALAEPSHPIWGAAPVSEGVRTPLRIALVTVLGESRLYAVGVSSSLLAWLACPAGPARRFAIGVPLAVAVVLLNPLLADRMIESVTGPLYWRTLWALPVPILITLVVVAPLRRSGRVGQLGCLALVLAFAVGVPEVRGFGVENRIEVAWPRLKVGPGYRWAESLGRLAPREIVVAPPGVSLWAPTLHDHAYPLIVRHYLSTQRERLGEASVRERFAMTHFVDGTARDPASAEIFERGLDAYGVQAAMLRISGTTPVAREILRRRGFRRQLQTTEMEIWVRQPSRGEPSGG